jgi:hypothetical protein
VSCEGGEGEGCVARGIPLGSSAWGVPISGPCSGGDGGLGSNPDSEERADSGDGGSSNGEERPPKVKGIGLISKGVIGGGFMGLGVTSFSGPSSNPWVAIAGNCTNVNNHSARTEKGRTSND